MATEVQNHPEQSVASLVGGSVSGIQNVVGSVGDDILVGTGGNSLTGGAYSSFLIAGIPSAVPGTLTIRFSRPTAFQSRRASSIVS